MPCPYKNRSHPDNCALFRHPLNRVLTKPNLVWRALLAPLIEFGVGSETVNAQQCVPTEVNNKNSDHGGRCWKPI